VSPSGQPFAGSCPSGSAGSATGRGEPSTDASFPGKLVRNSDGPRRGPPRSRRDSSSRVGGRGRGNRVPLYGHRCPRTSESAAAASRRARWRGHDRRCGGGSENGTRGASPGAGRSRVAWPFVLVETAAIVFSGASSSTSRHPCGRRRCSTWRGDDLEAGGRIASRSPSGGTCGRGHPAAGSLSPGPRWGTDDRRVLFLASARSMREPRAESRLPFFIPRGCSRAGYRKLSRQWQEIRPSPPPSPKETAMRSIRFQRTTGRKRTFRE
jgi:hypothetical protein